VIAYALYIFKVINYALQTENEYALGYIDDVSVFSHSYEHHLQHLANAFQTFRELGMTLKFKKCRFAKSTVKFLGRMVGSGVTTVMPDKISTMKNLPEPESKKMLRSFLGLC